MKAFPWRTLLQGHPLFAALSEEDILCLLTDEASHERAAATDDLIVRAEDPGDSLFLIGVGSVQVTIWGTAVAILHPGDIFGEIAVLERKPRSASVTARESCTLLEVEGEVFRQLLDAHPEMAAHVRATAAARWSRQP
jgi:voltage-gated potassium channel